MNFYPFGEPESSHWSDPPAGFAAKVPGICRMQMSLSPRNHYYRSRQKRSGTEERGIPFYFCEPILKSNGAGLCWDIQSRRFIRKTIELHRISQESIPPLMQWWRQTLVTFPNPAHSPKTPPRTFPHRQSRTTRAGREQINHSFVWERTKSPCANFSGVKTMFKNSGGSRR